MDIYEVLEYGSIVSSNEENRLIITYNGDATFNVFQESVDRGWQNIYVWDTQSAKDMSLLTVERHAEGVIAHSICPACGYYDSDEWFEDGTVCSSCKREGESTRY
jgi:hypothetical protein